ncbi:MAG: sulfite oxidase heme-binding subunit YedZ [Gammaproteobacteria bacterium]
MTTLSSFKPAYLKIAVFGLALLPLAKLVIDGWQDDLTSNPIEAITHRTGFWTLTFLLITLTATPLRWLFGWTWALRIRRMLGLYAFFYACLHFLSYLVLDQFFDWPAIRDDIVKRPYITVGFPAFLLLIPLAVTSSSAMIRRIGSKRWQHLHRLIYLVATAGVLHFAWLVKKDLSQPMLFGFLLLVLLGIRALKWSAKARATLPDKLNQAISTHGKPESGI